MGEKNIFWKFGVEALTPGPLLFVPVGYVKAVSRKEAAEKVREWAEKENLDDFVSPSRRGNSVWCLDSVNPQEIVILS